MTDGPVETPGEFAQFAEESGILAWLTDTDPGEPVAEEPQLPDTATTDRPRNELGQFISTKEEEEPVEAPAAEEEAEAPAAEAATEEAPAEESADEGEFVLEIDDDLQSILDKYDGDIGKALRALNESQSMIGRQANEVGELRQQLNEMQQAMQQGFQQVAQQPVFAGPYMNNIDENPQGLVGEALERGDMQTLELAIRAWGEEDPFAASAFLIALNQQAAAAAMEYEQPQAVSTPQSGPTLEAAMADVVARHPDVEKYLPAVEQVAQEFPTLRDSMRSGAPQLQAQAFEELLKIAKARSSATDTQAAVKRVVLKTQEEVRKERADAAVVSAQHQSAATSRSGLDQFYEAFGEAAERYEARDWITRSND